MARAELNERIFHFLPGSTLSPTALVLDDGRSDLLDAVHEQFPDRGQSVRWIEGALLNRLQDRHSLLDFHMEQRPVA